MYKLHLEPREKRALKNAPKRYWFVLVIAVMIASIATSYLYFLNQRRNATEVQNQIIESAQNQYNNYIVNLVSVVHAMEVDYIEALINGDMTNDVQNIFLRDMQKDDTIDQLRILDINGMETIRINKGKAGPYIVPEGELQDKSTRYYFTETKMLGRDQFLFSALDLNIEHDEIEIDPDTGLAKPTFRISTPVVLGETRLGYFVVNFLMRDFLSNIRNASNLEGAEILLFDENGYLLNGQEDSCNFGFCYASGAEPQGWTINDVYPGIDLSADAGGLTRNDEIISFAGYTNLSSLSENYFLAESASKTLYFLVSFNEQSIYQDAIRYSLFTNIINSWRIQLLVVLLVTGAFFISIFLVFLSNRNHFTNSLSDNRYEKSQLKRAFRNNEFVNYYQPVINIQDGTVLGFEALSRWKHNGKILAPDQFMDEILNYEMSIDLDENTYRNAQAARRKLNELGIRDYRYISINISSRTFENMMKENSGNQIRFTDEDKEYMLIELLEDIIIHKKAANKIYELHSQNVRFAIDDFGTGNSNIAFIRNFVDLSVKIDKAFVPKDTENQKECVIIEAFVKMFLDKGIRLIVEGVETREQYLYLKKLKVAGIQGYYFSKPLSFEEMVEFMQKKEYEKKLAA